jgi:hypothetical protein
VYEIEYAGCGKEVPAKGTLSLAIFYLDSSAAKKIASQ